MHVYICMYIHIYVYIYNMYIYICVKNKTFISKSCKRRFLVKRQVLPTSFNFVVVFKGYLQKSNLQKISLFDIINKIDLARCRSSTLKTSKIEFYMRNVKSLKL